MAPQNAALQNYVCCVSQRGFACVEGGEYERIVFICVVRAIFMQFMFGEELNGTLTLANPTHFK